MGTTDIANDYNYWVSVLLGTLGFLPWIHVLFCLFWVFVKVKCSLVTTGWCSPQELLCHLQNSIHSVSISFSLRKKDTILTLFIFKKFLCLTHTHSFKIKMIIIIIISFYDLIIFRECFPYIHMLYVIFIFLIDKLWFSPLV